jgi:cytochrome c-type biogenesis protein
MLQILLAILAGVLTVGAPCILPVLPIVLGTSIGQQNKKRPLLIAFGFVISFAAVSLLFSVFTRVLGLSPQHLRTIGMVLLLIVGLLLIWPGFFERIMLRFSPSINKVNAFQSKFSGNFGAVVIGLTIGIIWTPCAGPVFAAILTLIATSKNFGAAAVLLVFYAIGAGIPMILIAYGGQYASTKIHSLVKYTRIIQQIFGILIILLAISIYFGYDALIQAKISELFPNIATPKY